MYIKLHEPKPANCNRWINFPCIKWAYHNLFHGIIIHRDNNITLQLNHEFLSHVLSWICLRAPQKSLKKNMFPIDSPSLVHFPLGTGKISPRCRRRPKAHADPRSWRRTPGTSQVSVAHGWKKFIKILQQKDGWNMLKPCKDINHLWTGAGFLPSTVGNNHRTLEVKDG